MAVAETTAWEMSEPGTGPAPFYQDDDPSIKNGWRRGSPPASYSSDENPRDPFVPPNVFGTGGWAGDN